MVTEDANIVVASEPKPWDLYVKAAKGQPQFGISLSDVNEQKSVTFKAISPELLTETQFVQVQELLKEPLHADLTKAFNKNRSVLFGLAIEGEEVIGICANAWHEIVVNPSLSLAAQLASIGTFIHVVREDRRGNGIGSEMMRFVLGQGLPAWLAAIRAYTGKWIASTETYDFPDQTERTFTNDDVREALATGKVFLRVEYENARWASPFEAIVKGLPFFIPGHQDAIASMKKSSGVITPLMYDWDNDSKLDKVLEVSLTSFDGTARRGEIVNWILVGKLGFCRMLNKWLKANGFDPMSHGKGKPKGFWGSYDLMKTFLASADLTIPVIDLTKEHDVEAAVREKKATANTPTLLLVSNITNEMRAYGLGI